MSRKSPWKTLSSKVVYKNPWITVREDSVIRPDGQPGIYGVVETRIATGVVAITPENEVYLVGQFRYTTNEYSWEIIEGGTDADESPLEAAKRELEEEAGLLAEKWHPLGGEVHLTNCHSSEIGLLYLAQHLAHTAKKPDGTELLETKKVPLADCLQMIASGEIKDAMSIIGITRAAEALVKGSV